MAGTAIEPTYSICCPTFHRTALVRHHTCDRYYFSISVVSLLVTHPAHNFVLQSTTRKCLGKMPERELCVFCRVGRTADLGMWRGCPNGWCGYVGMLSDRVKVVPFHLGRTESTSVRSSTPIGCDLPQVHLPIFAFSAVD